MGGAVDPIERAQALRKRQTDAEAKLWRALRGQALGVKFRRQVPLGSYIVDFLCYHPRLVIEVDGGQHADNPYDAKRDAWLEAEGFRVLRFWNNEVLGNLEGVLQVIMQAAVGPPPHPYLPPPGGKGPRVGAISSPVDSQFTHVMGVSPSEGAHVPSP